jgi:hypothetical protein
MFVYDEANLVLANDDGCERRIRTTISMWSATIPVQVSRRFNVRDAGSRRLALGSIGRSRSVHNIAWLEGVLSTSCEAEEEEAAL